MYHEVTVINKDGVDYLKPTVTVPKMNIGNVEDYAFNGLFKNNEQLGKVEILIVIKVSTIYLRINYRVKPKRSLLKKSVNNRWRKHRKSF